jgi:hypothetical protein
MKTYQCNHIKKEVDSEECFDCHRMGRRDPLTAGRPDCQDKNAVEVPNAV